MRGDTTLMPRRLFVCILAMGANLLAAQAPTANSSTPQSLVSPASSTRDPELLAKNLRESYYHADNLSSMDCDVSVDWPALFKAVKAEVPPERLKILQGLKIRSNAVRGKSPEITFDWGNETFDNKEQVEDGFRKMVGGFYQFYWPMVASPLVKSSKDFSKIESLGDGASNIYESAANMSIVIRADKDGVPTHYSFDSVAAKGTIDAHYVPSPKPGPGDIRRISGITVSEQIGSSNINASFDLDYQSVNGFNIPKHVSFGISGAYSIQMEFSGCSVTAETPVTP